MSNIDFMHAYVHVYYIIVLYACAYMHICAYTSQYTYILSKYTELSLLGMELTHNASHLMH